MTDADIEHIFTLLKSCGFKITGGLSASDFARIEAAVGVVFPEDFRKLLSTGVPLGTAKLKSGTIGGGSFPDYKNDAVNEIVNFNTAVKNSFKFDIEHNDDFWLSEFGVKPKNTHEAVDRALAYLKTIPLLLPVFSHRCIPTDPSTAGNPVLSLLQPIDTIVYGGNLRGYFDVEFGEKKQCDIDLGKVRQVPFWTRLVEL